MEEERDGEETGALGQHFLLCMLILPSLLPLLSGESREPSPQAHRCLQRSLQVLPALPLQPRSAGQLLAKVAEDLTGNGFPPGKSVVWPHSKSHFRSHLTITTIIRLPFIMPFLYIWKSSTSHLTFPAIHLRDEEAGAEKSQVTWPGSYH